MAAESSARARPARTRIRSWGGCSTTACGSTRTCLRLTLGGGEMSNWGRYLTLLPPINGADAVIGFALFHGKSLARGPTCGTARSLSSTCPKSTSPGGRRLDIATPTFRISPGAAVSHLRARWNNGAPAVLHVYGGSDVGNSRAWRQRKQRAAAASASVWFPDLRRSEAKISAWRDGEVLGSRR